MAEAKTTRRARRPASPRSPRGAPIGVPVDAELGDRTGAGVPGGAPGDGGPFDLPGGPEPEGESPPSAQPGPPLCAFGMCPICMALTALGDARPELMEHVLLAS